MVTEMIGLNQAKAYHSGVGLLQVKRRNLTPIGLVYCLLDIPYISMDIEQMFDCHKTVTKM